MQHVLPTILRRLRLDATSAAGPITTSPPHVELDVGDRRRLRLSTTDGATELDPSLRSRLRRLVTNYRDTTSLAPCPPFECAGVTSLASERGGGWRDVIQRLLSTAFAGSDGV